jgi:hypothetical protein
MRMSAIWSLDLETAIKERSTSPYPITFGCSGDDYFAFEDAVNQGIDSRLEAVFTSRREGRFEVSADSLHVLVRRLMEAGSEEADSLASGICETLGIELI